MIPDPFADWRPSVHTMISSLLVLLVLAGQGLAQGECGGNRRPMYSGAYVSFCDTLAFHSGPRSFDRAYLREPGRHDTTLSWMMTPGGPDFLPVLQILHLDLQSEAPGAVLCELQGLAGGVWFRLDRWTAESLSGGGQLPHVLLAPEVLRGRLSELGSPLSLWWNSAADMEALRQCTQARLVLLNTGKYTVRGSFVLHRTVQPKE